MPWKAVVEVTGNCNSRCSMCDVWRERREDLPTEFYLDLAEKLNVRVVHITGGEPTLRRDLAEIVRAFGRRAFVELSTNGLIQFEPPPDVRISIGVSIDGTADTYKASRGLDLFDRAFSNFMRLRDEGGLVHVNYTISRANAGKLASFLAFLRERGVAAREVSLSVEQGGYLFRRSVEYDGEFIRGALRDLDSYERALREEGGRGFLGRVRYAYLLAMVEVMRRRLLEFSRGIREPVNCGAGREFFTVTFDGKLAPCNYVGAIAPLGREGFRKLRRFDSRSCRIQCLNFCNQLAYIRMAPLRFLRSLLH
ncbi:MAG: radical SAM protein [Candidatus Korarchaeum sp.]